jgi:guanine deaminase
MLNVIQNASIASKVIAMNAVVPDTGAKQGFAGSQLPIPTLFYLATLGGAEVCNLGHRTGSFSPGKSFDALLVSVIDPNGSPSVWGKEAKSDSIDIKKQTEKLEENLERFLFCGDDRNILKVYVQGCFVGGRSFEKKD